MPRSINPPHHWTTQDTLRVLNELARAQLRNFELIERTGLPRSTLGTQLRAMERAGLITHDSRNGPWRLTGTAPLPIYSRHPFTTGAPGWPLAPYTPPRPKAELRAPAPAPEGLWDTTPYVEAAEAPPLRSPALRYKRRKSREHASERRRAHGRAVMAGMRRDPVTGRLLPRQAPLPPVQAPFAWVTREAPTQQTSPAPPPVEIDNLSDDEVRQLILRVVVAAERTAAALERCAEAWSR
jgi:hypothetical protein